MTDEGSSGAGSFIKNWIVKRIGREHGKYILKYARRDWLDFTANQRVLPGYFIIGAAKSGTTSLYEYLCQHPAFVNSLKKEQHFFDKNYRYSRGLGYYRRSFRRKLNAGTRLSGDATPCLHFPYVPERIAQHFPDTKLIVLLRNPIFRAYSHHNHRVRRGAEPIAGFREALEAELADRPNLPTWRYEGENKAVFEMEWEDCRLNLYRGHYAQHLEHWLHYFDRGQFLILKSEDFFVNPADEVRKVLAFLGVPEAGIDEISFKAHNVGEYSGMDADTLEWLRAYYEPHNRALYGMLDVDFGWE